MEKFLVRVSKVQEELKAPKGQYNKFGKYNYRSCEDILEAVKPICRKYSMLLTLSDDIVNIGERYYVKASATLYDLESDEKFVNTAFAREALTQSGMTDSQTTGTASSYARKYALNGLFNIDDTKDADTEEFVPEKKTDWDKVIANIPKSTSEEVASAPKKTAPKKTTPKVTPTTNLEYRCIKCGKPFTEFKTADGKIYTPEQQYAMTSGICASCRKGKTNG